MSFNNEAGTTTKKVKYFVRIECLKIVRENRIRMFHLLRQHSKSMFTTALFFVELSFVIWLVTVIHGYKDGVLLALKLS